MELASNVTPAVPRSAQRQQERMPKGHAALDSGTLRRAFLDFFGRPPLLGERGMWIGRSRSELVEWALSTEEFWGNWLDEQLYYFLLIDNFRPAAESFVAFRTELAQGRIGVLEVIHRVCLSSSFDRRNPGPDTFVTVVMEQLLGIKVQRSARELEIGKRIYDGARGTFLGRPGSSQADVVHIAIGDRRAARYLMQREHERWLRQTPSEQDLSAWGLAVAQDPLAMRSILSAWFLSEAYDARLAQRLPQPNRLFVRALYIDLFDRMPSAVEVERLRNALDGLADSRPLRSLIARLILDSGKAPLPERTSIPDVEVWIGELFERLLGRAPRALELTAFLEAFADPSCRPATVLYAIVSHPEYQTW